MKSSRSYPPVSSLAGPTCASRCVVCADNSCKKLKGEIMQEMPPQSINHLTAQESQQDIVQRAQKWLNVLEERIILLLHAHEPQALKPGECEQAISRYLVLLIRLLQLRQQHAETAHPIGEQALLDALLRGIDE